jgi:hypothetical protein
LHVAAPSKKSAVHALQLIERLGFKSTAQTLDQLMTLPHCCTANALSPCLLSTPPPQSFKFVVESWGCTLTQAQQIELMEGLEPATQFQAGSEAGLLARLGAAAAAAGCRCRCQGGCFHGGPAA